MPDKLPTQYSEGSIRVLKGLEPVKQAVKLADLAMLFHNPNIGKGLPAAPQRVAVCRKGVVKQRADELPACARQLLGEGE